ncbi:ABC transporter permease [Falsigemmobacter intermedius]|uniref:ABC transporter permease n=1 Tax=Falsigemmobacter intermedius TaxID=1553448 RepID=A0A444M9F0_9RHOB|nr:ABC transporter permease [Falsigemmobacter intermedius]RWY39548.1 ABC transporter permease [Falsigemmobacter intermedius]
MTDSMNTAKAAAAAASYRPPRNQWWDVWDQFRTHKGAMFGMCVFVLLIGLVVLGPWLWDASATQTNMRMRNKPMSWEFPLGTDQLGRDILARVIAGGKTTLAVGLTAMCLSITLGATIGICAGFFRRADNILMRITDLFLALPLLPLLLLMVMLFREPLVQNFGPELGIFLLIVTAIALTSWMNTARIVRGEVLTIKEREFVLAARSIGTPARRIILRHILPSVLSPVMVAATLGIANAVITESALSFLGLGFPPDFPTWGRLLQDGMPYINLYPSRVLWPALALSSLVLSVNYIGDGLRDALDPRIRGR